MRKLVGSLFLLLLVLGLVFLLGGRNDRTPAAPSAVADAAAAQAELQSSLAPPRTDAREEPARVGLERLDSNAADNTGQKQVADTATVRVEVRWDVDDSPAIGVAVRIVPWGASDPFLAQVQGTTDWTGTFEREGLAPGRATFYGDRGGSASAELRAGETAEVLVRLKPGAEVKVRVVDEQDDAIAGASVWLSDYGNRREGVVVGRTDPSGRMRIEGVGEGRAVAAWRSGYQPSSALDVHGAVGAATEIKLVLAADGAGVRGVVRGPDEVPLAGVQLSVDGRSTSSVRLESGVMASRPPPRLIETDAAGSFEVLGLSGGRIEILARHGELAPFLCSLLLIAGEVLDHDIELRPGASVSGAIATADGAPASEVFVGIGRYGHFLSKQTRTAKDGSYRLAGLSPGRTPIRANHRELGESETEVKLSPEIEARWDVVLVAGDVVAGLVLGPDDAPLEGWRVTAERASQPGLWLVSSMTGADGAFRLDNCPAESFVICARPREWFGGPASAELDTFERGRTDLVLRVPADRLPSASLRGSVTMESGELGAGVQLILWSVEAGTGTTHELDTNGSFQITSLLPENYRLTIQAQGAGEHSIGPFELAPNEHRDLGFIQLGAGGALRARFENANDASPVSPQCYLRDSTGTRHSLTTEESVAHSGMLAPGIYTLVVSGPSTAFTETEIRIVSGERTEVELSLERGTGRILVFTVPDSCRREVTIQARDAVGRLVVDRTLRTNAQGVARVLLSGLVLGHYEVEVECASGARGSTDILVESLEPDGVPVELVME